MTPRFRLRGKHAEQIERWSTLMGRGDRPWKDRGSPGGGRIYRGYLKQVRARLSRRAWRQSLQQGFGGEVGPEKKLLGGYEF